MIALEVKRMDELNAVVKLQGQPHIVTAIGSVYYVFFQAKHSVAKNAENNTEHHAEEHLVAVLLITLLITSRGARALTV